MEEIVKFLTDFVWDCKTLVIPLVALMIISPILYLSGHKELAQLVANLGTLLVLVANLVYVVWLEKKKDVQL